MDRRLTHWACVFCRHENANNETSCTNCTGVRVQLGGADATAREDARRACRQRELQGRLLNARGVGTQLVPRAAQGVFDRTRRHALIEWEVRELEKYTGTPLYLNKEEGMLGIIESFFYRADGRARQLNGRHKAAVVHRARRGAILHIHRPPGERGHKPATGRHEAEKRI